jgi:hypothetical protein
VSQPSPETGSISIKLFFCHCAIVWSRKGCNSTARVDVFRRAQQGDLDQVIDLRRPQGAAGDGQIFFCISDRDLLAVQNHLVNQARD